MRYKCLAYLMRYAAWERAPEVYARLADDPKVPLGIVFDWAKIR